MLLLIKLYGFTYFISRFILLINGETGLFYFIPGFSWIPFLVCESMRAADQPRENEKPVFSWTLGKDKSLECSITGERNSYL